MLLIYTNTEIMQLNETKTRQLTNDKRKSWIPATISTIQPAASGPRVEEGSSFTLNDSFCSTGSFSYVLSYKKINGMFFIVIIVTVVFQFDFKSFIDSTLDVLSV